MQAGRTSNRVMCADTLGKTPSAVFLQRESLITIPQFVYADITDSRHDENTFSPNYVIKYWNVLINCS